MYRYHGALNECLGAKDETVRERAAADLEILVGVAGAKGGGAVQVEYTQPIA